MTWRQRNRVSRATVGMQANIEGLGVTILPDELTEWLRRARYSGTEMDSRTTYSSSRSPRRTPQTYSAPKRCGSNRSGN